MLVNYAYLQGAFMGKGGTISLVDGEIVSLPSLRGLMQPYTLVEAARGAGSRRRPPSKIWMTHPLRAQSIGRERCAPTSRGRPSRRTA